MDAFLSQKAYSRIKALGCLPVRRVPDGLLLGHRRAKRIFLEDIFPTQRGFFPGLQKYLEMNQIFGDKIQGFFSLQKNSDSMEKILVPVAFGKLFLKINNHSKNGLTMRSFLIEYDGNFKLDPIRLKIEAK